MGSTRSVRKTMIVGRIFRFFLGVFFLTEVLPVYRDVTIEGAFLRLGWAVGLVITYVAIHYLISNYLIKLNPIIGAVLAFGPLLAVFFIGYGGPAATGALTFLSASLLLAAIRSDPGCEVMSIPAVFLGRHTRLACLLFSPIDWLERRLKNSD